MGGAPSPVSQYCGDAIRDSVTEECDDGPGNEEDLCSPDCHARSRPVVVPIAGGGQGGMGADSAVLGRSLGIGRHPVAANAKSVAVSHLELGQQTNRVWVSLFDQYGKHDGDPLEVSSIGAKPTNGSSPVVAELPDERYAVVWADLARNSLDIALQVVSRGKGPIAGPFICNETTAGSQQDVDAIWTGSELVVAWSDALDLKYRRLSGGATPLESEQVLAATDAIESEVTLARHRDTWAAAWRSGSDGLERIVVKAGDAEWMTEAHLPGPSGDHPALIELDPEHLLLLFTEGTAPFGGPASTGRLRAAVLSHAVAGEVASSSVVVQVEPYASDATLSQSRPALVSVDGKAFAAWESESPLNDALGSELWLAEVVWAAASPSVVALRREIPLGADMARAGDQFAPSLSAVRQPAGTALVAVWEDASAGAARALTTDLLVSFRPIPLLAGGTQLGDAGVP
jgi:hypothetical protein